MYITSEPQEWTPIDPNLENELLNAYARIEELEKKLRMEQSYKSEMKSRTAEILEQLNSHTKDFDYFMDYGPVFVGLRREFKKGVLNSHWTELRRKARK